VYSRPLNFSSASCFTSSVRYLVRFSVMKILSGWFFKPFLLLYTLLRVLYEIHLDIYNITTPVILNKILILIYFVHCTHILLFISRFARIISIVNNTICHVIYLKFSKYLVSVVYQYFTACCVLLKKYTTIRRPVCV
jgi:hypothetical protein